MKDIKTYLPFYLGHEVYVQKKQGKESLVKGRICEITSGSNHGDWIMVQFENVVEFMYHNFDERSSNFHTFFIREDFIKLILRPLSDMTEEERHVLSMQGMLPGEWREDIENALRTKYLLSKGFDLFNLIPEGLAIDRTTLNNQWTG